MIPDWRLIPVIDDLGLAEDPASGSPGLAVYRGGRREARPALAGTDVLDLLGDVREWDGEPDPARWAWVGHWSEDGRREVFAHPGARAVLTWARGELTLVACATREAYEHELSRCEQFYGNERMSAEVARRRREARRAPATA